MSTSLNTSETKELLTPEYMEKINQLKKRVRYEYIRICRSRKRKKAAEAKVIHLITFVCQARKHLCV